MGYNASQSKIFGKSIDFDTFMKIAGLYQQDEYNDFDIIKILLTGESNYDPLWIGERTLFRKND